MRRRLGLPDQIDLFAASLPEEAPGPIHPDRAAAASVTVTDSRWRFSRPALASPHLRRIRLRLDLVRVYFPELDGMTIRVGLARARGVLGWGSLDASEPGIWVRPRRCDLFTIAHEMTHLLQARRIVPGGEATCDLYALARSAAVVDCEPSYVGCPPTWREGRGLVPGAAEALHRLAREAIDAHPDRPRRAIAHYRRALPQAAKDLPIGVRHGASLDRVNAILEVIP